MTKNVTLLKCIDNVKISSPFGKNVIITLIKAYFNTFDT